MNSNVFKGKRFFVFMLASILVLGGVFVIIKGNSLLSQPLQGYTCPSASNYQNLKSSVADSLCDKLKAKYATDTAEKPWLSLIEGTFEKREAKKFREGMKVSSAMFAYMKDGIQLAIDLKNKPVDEEGDTMKEIDEVGNNSGSVIEANINTGIIANTGVVVNTGTIIGTGSGAHTSTGVVVGTGMTNIIPKNDVCGAIIDTCVSDPKPIILGSHNSTCGRHSWSCGGSGTGVVIHCVKTLKDCDIRRANVTVSAEPAFKTLEMLPNKPFKLIVTISKDLLDANPVVQMRPYYTIKPYLTNTSFGYTAKKTLPIETLTDPNNDGIYEIQIDPNAYTPDILPWSMRGEATITDSITYYTQIGIDAGVFIDTQCQTQVKNAEKNPFFGVGDQMGAGSNDCRVALSDVIWLPTDPRIITQ